MTRSNLLPTRPYWWWGDPWAKPNPRTLDELIASNLISATDAQSLVGQVRAGKSLILAAPESGAGKSTLAHALIDYIPSGKHRLYIRGTLEPFDWIDNVTPDNTALLVNEFSPHLPTYCWGESAHRVLELAAHGFQLIATTHGSNRQEVFGQLMRPPISTTEQCFDEIEVFVLLRADDLTDHS